MTVRKLEGYVVATMLIHVKEDDQDLDPSEIESPVDWVFGAEGVEFDNRGMIDRVLKVRWARKTDLT